MSAVVNCPFCGEYFPGFANRAEAEHSQSDTCPMSNHILKLDQWKMRPPKKEQPATTVSQNEVEWLRGLVRDLVVEKTPETVTRYIYPAHIYAQRDGTGAEVESPAQVPGGRG